MKKQYTLTVKGKVKQVRCREFVEDMCKRLLVGGIIYDVGDYESKILCEVEGAVADKFCQSLKEYRPLEITETRIEEGIQLPYPLRIGVPV